MKKIIVLCVCLLSFFKMQSQSQNPVNWATSYKAISTTEGEILVTATIDNTWHMYSVRATEAGPIATTFTFTKSKQFELVGKVEETGSHEEFDKNFEAEIYVFNNKAEFKQKIKQTSKAGFTIPFKVEFTCCNDRMCLPPTTVSLNVKVQ